jgi:AraC-like DNA-binding protein
MRRSVVTVKFVECLVYRFFNDNDNVIQRYRLNEAAEELATGESISQSELALTLGYSDQAHFIRDFKSIVGVSPAAYARAARQS